MEEFLSTEAEWNSFLASLDKKMAGAGQAVESWKVGEPLNFDVNLAFGTKINSDIMPILHCIIDCDVVALYGSIARHLEVDISGTH